MEIEKQTEEVETPTEELAALPPDIIVGKKKLTDKIKEFFKNPKKRLIFIIVCGLILIGLVGLGFYFLLHGTTLTPAKTDTSTTTATQSAQTNLYEAILDGVMTDQSSANRHPLAVIVENHIDARPQSGLSKASVVYEAIAEGGITRFLALFGSNEADKVGPVRSARTYFVDWAHGYNAFIAHVGGNIDALDKIQAEHSYDLDEFAYTSPYWREYQAGLATEHTMYTSTTKLRDQATKNGYSTANNFTRYQFKDDPADADAAALPTSQTVDVIFGTNPEYNVSFVFDKATDSYKRFQPSGKTFTDAATKSQLNPKDIVVMTVKRTPTLTRINEQGYIMTTVGTGAAKIFLDGKVINGTWKKASTADREIFYDETGKEVVFNRGQLWICAIPPEGSVTAQ